MINCNILFFPEGSKKKVLSLEFTQESRAATATSIIVCLEFHHYEISSTFSGFCTTNTCAWS